MCESHKNLSFHKTILRPGSPSHELSPGGVMVPANGEDVPPSKVIRIGNEAKVVRAWSAAAGSSDRRKFRGMWSEQHSWSNWTGFRTGPPVSLQWKLCALSLPSCGILPSCGYGGVFEASFLMLETITSWRGPSPHWVDTDHRYPHPP